MSQTKRIIDYLKMDTNYAVLLTGAYGIGKTHWIKNELIPEIKKTPLQKDARKKFNAIHISLFGLKNIDSIYSAIFLALYPVLQKKSMKIGSGILKAFLRGAMQFNGMGDIDKYVKDLNIDPKDFTKYDEVVICFDDLDRKNKSLDLPEVFGLINSLVENDGVKIVVVANEIPDIKDDVLYSDVKKKVIGMEMRYSPNINKAFNIIIDKNYKMSDSLYYKWLKNHESTILEVVEHNEKDLRRLIFFLEHFKLIFGAMEKLFQENSALNYNKDKKQSEVLQFTLAMAFEFKSGDLNKENLEQIRSYSKQYFAEWELKMYDNLHSQGGLPKKEKENKTYIDLFRDKYYPAKKCYFLQCIVDFIMGCSSFDSEMLKSELANLFPYKEIPRQDVVLNKLDYNECLKLSEEEYRALTNEMLSFVDSGDFELKQYGLLFDLATRFDNILDYDIPELKTRFKEGIRKGKSHYHFPNSFRSYENTKFKEDIDEIIEFCRVIDKELLEEAEENEIRTLESLFQNDFDTFLEKFETEPILAFKPIWQQFSFSNCIAKIKSLHPQQIWQLRYHFGDRYSYEIRKDILVEKNFVLQLISELKAEEYNERKKSLKGAAFKLLISSLEVSILNFPKNFEMSDGG